MRQVNDPMTFHEAISSRQSDRWMSAMEEELRSINTMKFGNYWIYQKYLNQLVINS